MEYEFINDSLTGLSTARFSMEHEIMGPWLEVEIGKNLAKITTLLEAVADNKAREQQDILITGAEYTLILSQDSVHILSNSSFNDDTEELNNELEEGLMTDYDSSAECGIEDFQELLIKWSNFIK